MGIVRNWEYRSYPLHSLLVPIQGVGCLGEIKFSHCQSIFGSLHCPTYFAHDQSFKRKMSQSEMSNCERHYQAEDVQVHFGDSPLASAKPKKSQKSFRATGATFHTWPLQSDSTSELNLMDEDVPATPKLLSRATIFEANWAQPLYPPYIFTRSDAETLTFNIGRVISVFRQIKTDCGKKYISDGYARITAVDVIPARSDQLKEFIIVKIEDGGMQKERTRKEWDEVFGVNWFKVTLTRLHTELGDPMEIQEIRSTLEELSEEVES
jgi:hypothetical protein